MDRVALLVLPLVLTACSGGEGDGGDTAGSGSRSGKGGRGGNAGSGAGSGGSAGRLGGASGRGGAAGIGAAPGGAGRPGQAAGTSGGGGKASASGSGSGNAGQVGGTGAASGAGGAASGSGGVSRTGQGGTPAKGGGSGAGGSGVGGTGSGASGAGGQPATVTFGDPFFAMSVDQGSWGDEQAATLKSLGVGMVRLQFCDWKNQGTRDYLDFAVAVAQKHGLYVYAELNYCLVGGNPTTWHAGYRNENNTFNDAGTAFTADWVATAGDLAAHFAGKIYAYEIWNEPNAAPLGGESAPDWDGACGGPGGYTYDGPWALCPRLLGMLTTNAYMAIKAKDGGARVVAGNVLFHGTDGWVAKQYVTKLEESGAVSWYRANKGGGVPWDLLGIHPYAYRPGDGSLAAQLASMKAVLAAKSDPSPLAMTEYGWNTNSAASDKYILACPYPGFPSAPPAAGCAGQEDGLQAQYLKGSYQVARDAGVAFYVWFNYLDALNEPGLNFGLRRVDAEGKAAGFRPSAKAYCEAASAVACPL